MVAGDKSMMGNGRGREDDCKRVMEREKGGGGVFGRGGKYRWRGSRGRSRGLKLISWLCMSRVLRSPSS